MVITFKFSPLHLNPDCLTKTPPLPNLMSLFVSLGNFFLIQQSIKGTHVPQVQMSGVAEENGMLNSIIKCRLWFQLRFMMELSKIIGGGPDDGKGVPLDSAKCLGNASLGG